MFRKRNQRVRPSGEATLHSSGSTLPIIIIFFRIVCQNILKNLFFLFFNVFFPSFTFLSSWQMNLLRRRLNNPWQRRKRILIFCRVGMQVGGFPAWPEEEAWGLLAEAGLLYPLFLLFKWLFVVLLLYFPFDLSLQGLDLLKWASSLCEEACKLEMEAQHLEMKGHAKMKAVVAGS